MSTSGRRAPIDNAGVPGPRFRPPRVTLGAERRWVFLRAFGPPAAPLPAPLDGSAAARAALAMDAAARLVARLGLQRAADELGRGPALVLFEQQARVCAHGRRLADLAHELARLGGEAGVPLIFLKGVALFLAGVSRPEARPARDLDVLVPESQAEDFARRLRLSGFRAAAVPPRAHQLAPLHDDAGRVVEIHVHVPGLRLAGGRATFDALRDAGAWRRLPELPGEAGVPSPAALAAHALAHGLVQTGLAPHVYSLTRLIGDTLDLGLERDDGLGARAFALLDGAVTADEWDAWRRLARRLAAGDAALFDEAEQSSPERDAALLAHVVAGASDPGYRARLRARAALGTGGVGARVRSLWTALRPTDAQIDALYGRPRGRWGYAWRRLLRPFDLARRLLRGLSSP